MNLLVLVWDMLLDSFLYLEYLKLDHCYLLPISLPELFVSSHGGTMTMSLMHQWHDTICGGVIGPRRSLLYGAYGCILVACPPVSLSPPVTDLIITTCDFQKVLLDWNISPVNDGFDAKAMFNMYITKRINDKSLELLESCMLYK
ncbi:hypothetical protein Tco_1117155, partial [Tanacetum coccineum]